MQPTSRIPSVSSRGPKTVSMRPAPMTVPPPAMRPATPARLRPLDRETARIHLLEFVWWTRAGCQPVLYVVRTYLH